MKKITFLLLALPMLVFSQVTFDFKTSQDALGWVKAGGAQAATIVPEGLALSWIENKQPKLRHTNLNVDASMYKWVAVTLINNSAEANNMRFGHFKGNTGSGTKYITNPITANTASKTYFYDLEHSEWVNYANDADDPADFDEFDIFFNMDGGNLTNPSTNGDIIISKIEFLALPFKYEYTFDTDGDLESWVDYDNATTVAGGFATAVPVVGKVAKIRQETFRIDPANASHIHIVYKNESADNNQLRVAWVTDGESPSYPGSNISIQTSTAGFETVSFDLADAKGADWTAQTAKNLSISIRDTNNGNKASAGNLIIDRIVFNNDAILSSENVEINNTVSLYPNPVVESLNISSQESITSVAVYSITGNLILVENRSTTQLNVGNLASGIYIVQVSFDNGGVVTQKFVKQ